jgi:uncharacterized protein (TIGR01777 family)
MKTVLIAGGTGLIGSALTKALLQKGYKVIILTRKFEDTIRQVPIENLSYAYWNIESHEIDESAFAAADFVIHLAGAGVAEKRWTRKRKQEIVDSRTVTSRLIVERLSKQPGKVQAVISSSAIGWYGPDPAIPNAKPFVETDPADDSFLGKTCLEWEQSIEPVAQLGIRLVRIRTGIVLSDRGGALAEFIKPLRFRAATILGSGKQVVSWIHINDLVAIYIWAIENEKLSGVFNAVGPKPVTNRELVMELAKIKCGRFFVPVRVPAFALKLLLGEMSIEVLKSATVSADKLQQSGFQFEYPRIGPALQDLLKD